MDTEEEGEQWLDSVEYPELFSVSSFGRVWSKRTSIFLVQGTLHNGYKVISTRIGGREGVCVCMRVHRMVAKAFIANPENKPQVNHKDGVKGNNYTVNLEWSTGKENVRHAFDTGLATGSRGCDNYNSKLTEVQVKYILENCVPYCKTNSYSKIADELGVHRTQVSRVFRRESYN